MDPAKVFLIIWVITYTIKVLLAKELVSIDKTKLGGESMAQKYMVAQITSLFILKVKIDQNASSFRKFAIKTHNVMAIVALVTFVCTFLTLIITGRSYIE